MTTLEAAFEEFKKLPDWDRFPLPEVMYQHFNLKKPKPSVSLMDALTYQAPPHESLNKNGKVEIRPPAEGGVRQIELPAPIPTEVKKVNEETGELEDFPPPKPVKTWEESAREYLDNMKFTILKDQTSDDTKTDSDLTKLNLPTADSTKGTQPESDPSYLNLLRALSGIVPAVPCHDAECNPASQKPQNESS